MSDHPGCRLGTADFDASQPEKARKAVPLNERGGPPIEHASGVWNIRSLAAARHVLRAHRNTTQAGFTAEWIPRGAFRAHPILISDGADHDEQRRRLSRLFAPAVISQRYGDSIARCAQSVVDEAVVAGRCRVDDAALHYSVDVTAGVVGLTASEVDDMARRLVAFFRQPPIDLTAEHGGRTNRQWLRAAVNGLVPLLAFYLRDVRPAIRRHRRDPHDDVISHLIDSGYGATDILVECVTYGTAGMVTTREFISMACWHLLDDEQLRKEYVTADQTHRLAILEEVIRLEPVVGHLYRRAIADMSVGADGDERVIPRGDLVDICVRATNTDPCAYGDDAETLRSDRSSGSARTGLSFSDGAHSCPGRPLALLETDALLHRLLDCAPRRLTEPTVEWDDLIAGYKVRGLELGLTVPARPRSRNRPRRRG